VLKGWDMGIRRALMGRRVIPFDEDAEEPYGGEWPFGEQ